MNTHSARFPTRNPLMVTTVDVSPRGNDLVVGQQGDDRSQLALGLWSLDDGHLIAELVKGVGVIPLTARFTASGNILVFSDAEQALVLYDIKTKTADKNRIPRSFIKWVGCAQDCNRLIAGGVTTEVWDLDKDLLVWTLPVDPLPATRDIEPPCCALSADGRYVVASGVAAKQLLIYECDTGKIIGAIENTMDSARSIAFDSSGRLLAAVSNTGGAGVWDLQSGKALASDVLNMRADFYWCIRVHPDGKHVGLGLWSGFVRIVNLDEGEYAVRASTVSHQGRVMDLAFSRDGKRMVTGGEDGVVLVWDL